MGIAARPAVRLAPRAVDAYDPGRNVQRITVNPGVRTGKPCIRGVRFPAARLLGLLAAGETREAILANYPYLEAADIDAALRQTAATARN